MEIAVVFISVSYVYFRVTGLKRSPFGQTSLRFAKEHHVKKTPGFISVIPNATD